MLIKSFGIPIFFQMWKRSICYKILSNMKLMKRTLIRPQNDKIYNLYSNKLDNIVISYCKDA